MIFVYICGILFSHRKKIVYVEGDFKICHVTQIPLVKYDVTLRNVLACKELTVAIAFLF